MCWSGTNSRWGPACHQDNRPKSANMLHCQGWSIQHKLLLCCQHKPEWALKASDWSARVCKLPLKGNELLLCLCSCLLSLRQLLQRHAGLPFSFFHCSLCLSTVNLAGLQHGQPRLKTLHLLSFQTDCSSARSECELLLST